MHPSVHPYICLYLHISSIHISIHPSTDYSIPLFFHNHVSIITWVFSARVPLPHGPPQLHLAVSQTTVKVVIDCKIAAEKGIGAPGNITTEGVEVLGRMVRSRGKRDSSAPVSTVGLAPQSAWLPNLMVSIIFH